MVWPERLQFSCFFRILWPYPDLLNEVMTMRLLIAEDELDLAEALTVFFEKKTFYRGRGT